MKLVKCIVRTDKVEEQRTRSSRSICLVVTVMQVGGRGRRDNPKGDIGGACSEYTVRY